MMTMDQPWAEFFFFWWMRWRAPSIPGDDRSSMFNMNRPQLELPMSSCCFRRSGVSVVRPCYYGYRVDYKVHLICCFPCMLSFICTHCCVWHVIFLTIQLDSSLVKKIMFSVFIMKRHVLFVCLYFFSLQADKKRIVDVASTWNWTPVPEPNGNTWWNRIYSSHMRNVVNV